MTNQKAELNKVETLEILEKVDENTEELQQNVNTSQEFAQWENSNTLWQVEPSAGPAYPIHTLTTHIGSAIYNTQESVMPLHNLLSSVQTHYSHKSHNLIEPSESIFPHIEENADRFMNPTQEVESLTPSIPSIDEIITPQPEEEETAPVTNQVIKGSNKFNDNLEGGAGDDKIYGRKGDDTLRGNDGADQLRGGNGDDTLIVDAQDTLIQGGRGNDTIIIEPQEVIHINTKSFKRIEQIDMDNDNNEEVYLDLKDVVKLSDTDSIFVNGNIGDSVHIENLSKANIQENTTIGEHTYAHYQYGKADLYIELGIQIDDISAII
tara:strand:+ start:158560 stop:159525 length:966 start_codon:yes stop_codon:yes gene_type:complete